ncbi:hypothetical protein BGX27_006763 [Mortierella sp. AM989]|nr:hypothetical protein BGX27_006763 [Mortierella sp. AM989]
MANALCPPQQSPATRSLSYSSSHHRGSIMPENAPTKRGRPLTDVLAKPDIFVQLHAAFVSVLSNCSRRLTERHVQGRLVNECVLQEKNQNMQSSEPGQHLAIDSLWELRRVLGRQQFNRLIWNTVVGNQVIVRGDKSSIVNEIIGSLEEILPKDCSDWSSATLIADMKELSTRIEKTPFEAGEPPYTQIDLMRPPASSPGAIYSPGTTASMQRQKYLLQAGEEPPESLQLNSGNMSGVDEPGRNAPSHQNQQCLLYVETVNEILDYRLPRSIEAKRLALLREEWIRQVHYFNII